MIKTEVNRGIGILTLARSERKNAINRQMMEQMADALEAWEDHEGVKCVLISGEGDAFCSGGDLQQFHSFSAAETHSMLSRMNQILTRLYQFPKPTIAALNGLALGGGCELATSCDFRLAHEQVQFGFIQIRLGITTGWGGATRLFSRLPQASALRLLLSGDVLTAQEGVELGFITHLLPRESFFEHALQWSAELVKHPLPAIMAYKQALLDYQQPQLTMTEKMAREVERGAKLWNSDEHEAAVSAFLKRSNSQ